MVPITSPVDAITLRNMAHKHLWKFLGIVLGGVRNGMSHRACKCGGEMYLPATKKELKRHDPHGEVAKDAGKPRFH